MKRALKEIDIDGYELRVDKCGSFAMKAPNADFEKHAIEEEHLHKKR